MNEDTSHCCVYITWNASSTYADNFEVARALLTIATIDVTLPSVLLYDDSSKVDLSDVSRPPKYNYRNNYNFSSPEERPRKRIRKQSTVSFGEELPPL